MRLDARLRRLEIQRAPRVQLWAPVPGGFYCGATGETSAASSGSVFTLVIGDAALDDWQSGDRT